MRNRGLDAEAAAVAAERRAARFAAPWTGDPRGRARLQAAIYSQLAAAGPRNIARAQLGAHMPEGMRPPQAAAAGGLQRSWAPRGPRQAG